MLREALINSLTPLSRLRGERSEGGEAGLYSMLGSINQTLPRCSRVNVRCRAGECPFDWARDRPSWVIRSGGAENSGFAIYPPFHDALLGTCPAFDTPVQSAPFIVDAARLELTEFQTCAAQRGIAKALDETLACDIVSDDDQAIMKPRERGLSILM